MTALSTDQLLARAVREKTAAPGRTSTERWVPVVDVLRRKGWSYAQIYEWLKQQGEPVQSNRSSFTSAVSTRYRRWIEAQRREALKKSQK